jgi:hypothetical protein
MDPAEQNYKWHIDVEPSKISKWVSCLGKFSPQSWSGIWSLSRCRPSDLHDRTANPSRKFMYAFHNILEFEMLIVISSRKY